MDVSFVFGVLGNIVAALLFLSPLDTFWRIVKNRSTEDFECIPYVVMLLNASQWTFYGIIKHVILLVTINGLGSLLMVIYLLIFLIFAPRKIKVRMAALVLVINVGVLGAVILITSLAMSRKAQINTIGTLCDGVTIISFASPLTAMKTVVTTKSVEYMPFFLSFFNFLCGMIWSIYAILTHDTFILIPNGMEFLLGVAQLALYAWYRIPMSSKGANGALEEGDHRQEGTCDPVPPRGF